MFLQMRKHVFAYAKTKTQINEHNSAVGKRLCFRYIKSSINLLSDSEISSLQPSSMARFVSDLVGNPEDRFSHDAADT